MIELEQYLFDLQGFLVVEDALTSAELAALNEIIDQQIALVDEPGKLWFRFDLLLSWGAPFQIYKYSPYPSAWLRNYYNPDDYPDLTEAQRNILRNPGVYPY